MKSDASRTLRLDPIVDGPVDGETIVFIQGWPDDATLWEAHVGALSDRYRCVRTTLPNFDGRRTERWGYRTDEIVEALAAMIREVSPDGKVTLVLHDWGCYWGHLLHRRSPELVARVAGLDIGGHIEPGLRAILGTIAYQGWLFVAFLLGGSVGDWMTRAMAGAMRAPMPRQQIHSWMNYPYRNIWQDIFSGRARREMEDYWPQVPLLFVYGKKKPFPFHSEKWAEHVESVGGEVVALDCDHWVPRDPAFGKLLDDWLDAVETPPGSSR